jgi:DHA3 family macrolide efflux protein-like MFS transporter
LNWKRNTALFMASQTLSLLGTMIVQYAIMWHLVLSTGSGLMMTLYVVVGVLPTFCSSIFGGVLADRYDKKLLINLSDGGIGLVSLLFALFLFSGHDSMALLLVAAGLRALGQGVQQPTVGSLIPLIVPEEKLLRVNGLNSSLQSGIFIVSPIAAASLMGAVPLGTLFLVDVATALAAIAILQFLVKIPRTPADTKPAAERTSYFRDLTGGLRYIRSKRYLLLLIVMSTLFVVAISPVACLSPLQVTRNFGDELWRLSAIEIVWASGMVVGGVLVGVWSFRNRTVSIGVSSVVTGVMIALLGVWRDFGPYLACMAFSGIVQIYSQAPSMTLLQERVAPEFLGRVMSVFTMIGSLAMPVGIMVFGPMADVVSIDSLMIGTGAAIVVLGVLYLSSRTLREAGLPLNENATNQ